MFKGINVFLYALIIINIFFFNGCASQEQNKVDNYENLYDQYRFVENVYDFNENDGSNDYIPQFMSVSLGLNNIGEKFIGEYGTEVYRYAYIEDNGNVISCVRVVLNSKKTVGEAVIIHEQDKVIKKMNKESIQEFKQLISGIKMDNISVCEPICWDGGAYYCFETYYNNKHSTIIRWDGENEEYFDFFESIKKVVMDL